jgi:uncharacterized membrane protein
MQSETFQDRGIADSDPLGVKLGKGLGWFSIGLGLVELLAPRRTARMIGVQDDGGVPPLLRAFGLREIAAGALLLSRPGEAIGPWTRVAGDLLDLAMLGLGLGKRSVSRPRTFATMGVVAGALAIDTYAGVRQQRRKLGEPVRRAVTIARPAHEVYAMWRNLERLPEFMSWVLSVRDLGGGVSHWVVKTPAGVDIEYDAEITEDVPSRRIAWRSLPGASVPNAGCVTFLDAPGGRGTEVVVELQVAAPLGKTIAGHEAQGDLRRLKQVLETGEVLLSDTSIHKGSHPAQPPMHGEMR